MLNVSGRPVERGDAAQRFVGHDTTLQGWPWVVGTHSWVEPTAISMFALRSAGQAGHPRCREAVKLLLDRQLPAGGWNYGNTTVLGHVLRAQVQPTGLALAALADETDIRPKVLRSLQWLEHTLAGTHDDRLALLCTDGTGRARPLAASGKRVATVGIPADPGTPRFAVPRGAVGAGGTRVGPLGRTS